MRMRIKEKITDFFKKKDPYKELITRESFSHLSDYPPQLVLDMAFICRDDWAKGRCLDCGEPFHRIGDNYGYTISIDRDILVEVSYECPKCHAKTYTAYSWGCLGVREWLYQQLTDCQREQLLHPKETIYPFSK